MNEYVFVLHYVQNNKNEHVGTIMSFFPQNKRLYFDNWVSKSYFQ